MNNITAVFVEVIMRVTIIKIQIPKRNVILNSRISKNSSSCSHSYTGVGLDKIEKIKIIQRQKKQIQIRIRILDFVILLFVRKVSHKKQKGKTKSTICNFAKTASSKRNKKNFRKKQTAKLNSKHQEKMIFKSSQILISLSKALDDNHDNYF